MFSNYLFAIAALLTSSVGIVLLWCWWQQNNKIFLVAASPFVIASQLCWQLAYNNEFGTVYFLLFIGLIALLVIAKNASTAPVKAIAWRPKPLAAKLFSNKALIIAIITHAIVLAIVSVLITLMLAQVMPFSQANQMAFAALVLPVIWALLSTWLLFTHHKKRTYLFIASATLAASLAILFTGPFAHG